MFFFLINKALSLQDWSHIRLDDAWKYGVMGVMVREIGYDSILRMQSLNIAKIAWPSPVIHNSKFQTYLTIMVVN